MKIAKAQGHILWIRKAIDAILPDPEDTVEKRVPRTEDEWKSSAAASGSGNGWRFVRGREGIPTVVGGGAVKKPVKENPVEQVMGGYKKTGKRLGGYLYYDAIYSPNDKGFVLDSHGRPMKATAANLKKVRSTIPNVEVATTQQFEPSGNCALAKDNNGAKECRVCWGVTGGKRSEAQKQIPIIYPKH